MNNLNYKLKKKINNVLAGIELGKGGHILDRSINQSIHLSVGLNDVAGVVFGSSTKAGTFCFICLCRSRFESLGSELIMVLKSHKFSKKKKNQTFCVQQRSMSKR